MTELRRGSLGANEPLAPEEALLDEARRGLEPTAARIGALYAGLSARLPLDATASPTEPSGAASGIGEPKAVSLTSPGAPSIVRGSGRALRFSAKTLGLGTALGGLVGFALGFQIASQPITEEPTPTPARSQATTPAYVLPAEPTKKETTLDNPHATTNNRAPPSVAPSPRASAVPVRPPPATPDPPRGSDEPTQPTFYEELSYVRRAQAALGDGNPALALGLMQSLDEIQTHGALLAERTVTRVLALCALGRTEEATQIARRVISESPNQLYTSRLRASCAQLTSPEKESNDH